MDSDRSILGESMPTGGYRPRRTMGGEARLADRWRDGERGAPLAAHPVRAAGCQSESSGEGYGPLAVTVAGRPGVPKTVVWCGRCWTPEPGPPSPAAPRG